MIRVLHVIATLDPAGAERQLAHLCCRLVRGEFQPSVCCLTRGGPLVRLLREAQVPVMVLHKRGRWDLRAIQGLLKVMRRFRPHIVHTWLPTANTLGRVAGILAGTPALIASERAADVWKGALRRRVDRLLVRRSAVIVANADAVRRFLVERVGLEAAKITVIRNGLDVAEFDSAAARQPCLPAPQSSEGPIIGTVGRLGPQKGMKYLIDAFARLPDDLAGARLWVVGGGEEEPVLRARAIEARVEDRVHFLGTRPDVPALMTRLDLFVLPSLWEGLPNVVLEAMAARRAVVATRVDGTPEAAVDGETALLVPPADPGALARAMETLLRDAGMRRAFGEAGRRRVEKEFTMSRMVAETQQLYRRVVRRRSRHG